MKSQTRLKNPPRPLFSCNIFRHCTQTILSPTTPQAPTLPAPTSDPPHSHHLPTPPDAHPPLSSSSSSSTSQSFTQWRFPLPHHPPTPFDPPPESDQPVPPALVSPSVNLHEIFHVAELQLSPGTDVARLSVLHLLERSLVPNPSSAGACPPAVMAGVVSALKDDTKVAAKPATKVLLALCLEERNRHVAVNAGAVAAVVEAVPEMESSAAERALAALELLCIVPEGTAELRSHALAVPVLVDMVGKLTGRGKECAISVLAAVFADGGGEVEPTAEVARAVVVALQGECNARGRRKGGQLLKSLKESGRLDLTEEGF